MSEYQFRAVRGPAHGEPDCITIYDPAVPDMEGVVITAEGAAQLRDALNEALGTPARSTEVWTGAPWVPSVSPVAKEQMEQMP